jgi:hypothetical protein
VAEPPRSADFLFVRTSTRREFIGEANASE